MSKEFQKSNTEKLKGPSAWALAPRTHIKWIRQVGSRLDIDVEKYILGNILVSIISDDANTFAWTVGGFFDSNIASGAKRDLLERMDWEINTPETPEMIREGLKSVLQAISPLNWKKKKEFDQAKTKWYQLKEWTEKQIKEHPKLKEAKKYRLTQTNHLPEH